MKYRLLDYLVCPNCKEPFELEVDSEDAGEVRTGRLLCKKNDCVFKIEKFVPRFVDADLYADTFSKQRLYVRRHFKHYKEDTSGDEVFLPTTQFSPKELKHGVTLEVGCGYGRFIDVIDRLGGEVIGVDLSTHSIELAQDFVGSRKNVHLIQCDLFRMPFDLEKFPRIFSIGVLHHTPDTRAAFKAIVPYIEKGGEIAIWVYPPELNRSVDRWRHVTTKIPTKWLYVWCFINEVAFSWIRGLPGGWRFGWIIPGGALGKRPFWLRVVGNFDALSPEFAHTHTESEVKEWFLDSGLVDVELLPRSSSAKGRKPR